MNKFILISFGFLGWAFYEMSGGDAFEPASVRMAHLLPKSEPVAETPVTPVQPVARAQAATPAQITQTALVDTAPPALNEPALNEDVSRATLNLAALEDALSGAVDTDETAPLVVSSRDGTGVPRNVGSISASADTPAIIPSLIAPNAGTTQVPVASNASLDDIRTVTGNRVNVRGGPGTDFSVVTRLVRGDEVEILEDNGDGWVRLRPLDGGTEGWMADFLLTGG